MDSRYIKIEDVEMITRINWRLKKPILECLRDHSDLMSAQEISKILNVEVHKVSMCLLRLRRQDLIEAPPKEKRKKDEALGPGHRNRAAQFYQIKRPKGIKRLEWYAEQEKKLKKPEQQVQPEESEQQVQIKKPKKQVDIKKPEPGQMTFGTLGER